MEELLRRRGPAVHDLLVLQAITPGRRASLSYAGAALALGILGAGTVLVLGGAVWRRRRDDRGPLETDAPAAGDGA